MSGPDPTRFSVIIPTYNSCDRLVRTIQSVLDQNLPAAEIIVVDDGSVDDTPMVARRFGDRISYFRVPNGGQQRARNLGVRAATGDWIVLLDHDDLFDAGYLAEVDALVRAHAIDLTICNSRTWRETGEGGDWADSHRFTQFAPPGYWAGIGVDTTDRWTILDRYPLADYLRFHPCQTSMVAIRRDLYLALGGFEERMRGSMAENLEFELKAIRAARVGLIWAPLVTMIRHDSNTSLDSRRMAMDVIACLDFARTAHGLDADGQAVLAHELQLRLPAGIYGAFSLGDYAAVRHYAAAYCGELHWKARIKVAIARLPRPAARTISRLLGT